MTKAMLDRFPVFLIVLVVLICVGVCFDRFDIFLVNELKAIVSVIFGFATSCLLLSFIWLMQKKPIQNTWPVDTLSIETPSMNPRGAQSFVDDLHNVVAIRSVSSLVDHPPKYEDALINSKPLDWTGSEKASSSELKHTRVIHACNKHPDKHIGSGSRCPECRPSFESISSESLVEYKPSSRNGRVAQLALSLVRGFTASDSAVPVTQQQDSRHSTRSEPNENQNSRKPSFCQLDVGQIMISGSPPKYCDLDFSDLQEYTNSSNVNYEYRAGNRRSC